LQGVDKNLENNRRKIPPKSKKQGIKANYIPPTNNKNKALKKDNNNINRLVNNIIKDKKI
jgi:hypothetical protein